MDPNKNLGQHWLKDKDILSAIAGYADLTSNDVVVEIGPGLGTLTWFLTKLAGRVIAVEFDTALAKKLAASELTDDNLIVKNEDFLHFDLEALPEGYKIVGNIPYYITGKIIRKILAARNRPEVAVLLVQKEVAERIAAEPGDMSILSVITQYYSEVSLGRIVSADKFTPPPKVDSQVVVLKPFSHGHNELRSTDLEKKFLLVVKAGFSARRKKLHTSLAGGLGISLEQAKQILEDAEIDSNLRAQNLSIDDWVRLAKRFEMKSD